MEQANVMGLDIVTLPSHTSYALQPLDVSYFKPFKIIYKKERDLHMVTSRYTKPDNSTFALWVNKAMKAALTKQNI